MQTSSSTYFSSRSLHFCQIFGSDDEQGDRITPSAKRPAHEVGQALASGNGLAGKVEDRGRLVRFYGGAARRAGEPHEILVLLAVRLVERADDVVVGRAVGHAAVDVGARADEPAARDLGAKIGRASGRERV